VIVNDAEQDAGLAATPNYRYADLVGNQLFVAGQLPLDTSGTLLGADDPSRQARVCLDNLATLLAVHGFAINDIHRLTVYVVGEHQHLLDAWGSVVSWFANDVPPATLLGVNMLGYSQQLVEIDAVIARDR
jgi:enamine deaminase RidA (YjgF/YER057c/UK114 family)